METPKITGQIGFLKSVISKLAVGDVNRVELLVTDELNGGQEWELRVMDPVEMSFSLWSPTSSQVYHWTSDTTRSWRKNEYKTTPLRVALPTTSLCVYWTDTKIKKVSTSDGTMRPVYTAASTTTSSSSSPNFRCEGLSVWFSCESASITGRFEFVPKEETAFRLSDAIFVAGLTWWMEERRLL